MRLTFSGSRDAELFTREIEASMDGAILHLLDTDPDSSSYGFMQASFDGRPWTDTMWTRDAGVMLRELACYGKLDHAKALALCLIRMVEKNEAGFYTYPEHLDRGKSGSGEELDGTASICIGMVYLLRRLKKDDPAYEAILAFMLSEDSPIAFAKMRLKATPLIEGTGEFGGGCGIPGRYVNSVQNALVRGMLLVFAQFLDETGRPDAELRAAAEVIRDGMLRHLLDADGSWIWCVEPGSFETDERILNDEINKGLGHINDVTALLADVEGLNLTDPEMLSAGRATMDRLYRFPRRAMLLDTTGMWLQFDEYMKGGLSSPSYGCGYAIQAMALTDRRDWLTKCVRYLAEVTYAPVTAITRSSPYWFYERFYAADRVNEIDTWEGCGALNLVNVAEPLKVARMLAGADCAGLGRREISPRLPEGWKSVTVENWLIPTEKGNEEAGYTYRAVEPGGKPGTFAVLAADGSGYACDTDCRLDLVRFGPFTTDEVKAVGGEILKTEKTDEGLYYYSAKQTTV